MKGTEKQVKYAEDIKNAVLPIAKKFELKELIEKMESEENSVWFIENANLKSALGIKDDTKLSIKLDAYKNVISVNIDIIADTMKDAKIRERRAALRPYWEMIEKLDQEYIDCAKERIGK